MADDKKRRGGLLGFLGFETVQPPYNPSILKSFEYFLDRESTQNRLINNLIKDYAPDTADNPGSISFTTVISLAGSFVKAPGHTLNLLRFYRNQEKHNTPGFQEALIDSSATWGFVERTADKLERIVPLMQNMGVDLFSEGKPLDEKGMEHIKGSLKNTQFRATLKEIVQDSQKENPNYLKITSKLLGAIDQTGAAKDYFKNKGESIENYIVSSIKSQIEQDKARVLEWDGITGNSGRDPEQLRIFREEFLDRNGITGEARDKALETGELPKTIEDQLRDYGLKEKDLDKIMKIVPMLLDSPGGLKKMVDSLSEGNYLDIARQVLDLADKKPEIKEYLNENKEIFGKVVSSVLQTNDYTKNSGVVVGGLYDIVPALFENTSVLREIIDVYAKEEYTSMVAKTLDMMASSPSVRAYFQEHKEDLEKLITASVKSQIEQDKQYIAEWADITKKRGHDPEQLKIFREAFLDSRGITGEVREKALATGELPKTVYEQLADYGLEAKDLDNIMKIVPMLLDSPGELKTMVESFSQGNYPDIARQVLDLADNNPEIKQYLNENKETFGKVVSSVLQSNAYTKNAGVETGALYNIVPALFENTKALKEMIDIYEKGDYNAIAAKTFDLIINDPKVRNYFQEHQQDFEKLTTAIIEASIHQSREALKEENQKWQQLDPEAKRAYLNQEEKWKNFSNADKDKMIANNKLHDLGDTLANLGINQEDIGAISRMAVLALNNPENTAQVLGNLSKMANFATGGVLPEGLALDNLTDMAKNALTLMEQSPEMTDSLNEQKALIGKIVQANMASMPGLKDINPAGLVPFLVNHPKEMKQIIDLVREEKYNKITPIILELAKTDRSLANYLAENKTTLASAAMVTTGFDKYDISPEIADILVNLTTENNLSKLQDLAALAEKGEWVKVGAGLADMIDKDPEFRESLKNNRENINKIVDVILAEQPGLRSSVAALDVGTLANNMLSNPGQVRDLLNSYDSGSTVSLVMQGAKFVASKLMDSETRGVLTSAAGKMVVGIATKDQQEMAEGMASILSSRANYSKRVNLSEIIQKSAQKVAEGITSEQEKKQFLKETSNSKFFEGTTIKGTSIKPVRFDSLDINGMQFVNTKFENVSLTNTKITKTSFHGASFKNTSFVGVTMDGATLESLLPEIKKGTISLQGVKIEGSLDNMDLKEVSFKGADLSAVTSMKDTNIEKANFQGATSMPPNAALTQAFGLQSIESYMSKSQLDTLISQNREKIGEEIANKLVAKAKSQDIDLTKEEIAALKKEVVRLYTDKSEIGERFRGAIASDYKQLTSGDFPQKTESIKNTADYQGKASNHLTMLYDNIKTPEKMEAALVADILAQQVNKDLFAQGANRGKDGLEIRKALEVAISEFTKESGMSARDILSDPNKDKVMQEITENIRSKTKYTNVGMASGGIYLPEGAISEDMSKRFAMKMNIAFGDNAISSKEKEQIADMANAIATNIFGPNAKNTHSKDIEQITAMLETSFYKLKKDNPQMDLGATIAANKDKLVGALDRGYLGTTGTGLTKDFYDNATYTGKALSSSVKTEKCQDAINKTVKEAVSDNVKESKQNKTQTQVQTQSSQVQTENVVEKAKAIGKSTSKQKKEARSTTELPPKPKRVKSNIRY